MSKTYTSLRKQLQLFKGITDVEISKAEEDTEDGGVFPATLSLMFAPSALGMHTLEFIIWAFGDIHRAGANVHVHLSSPPPWLNIPGTSLNVNVYINPRNSDSSIENVLHEVEEEIQGIGDFLKHAHKEYWPLCHP